jgi:hypothetical protein
MVSRREYAEPASSVKSAGTGSASMTVHGSSMGIVRHTARGRTGHTGCEGTDWVVGDVGEMQGSSWGNSNSKNHNVNGAEDS